VQQAEICTSVGASIRAFYLAPLFELLLGLPIFCIQMQGLRKAFLWFWMFNWSVIGFRAFKIVII
jgi:hypothetical protein